MIQTTTHRLLYQRRTPRDPRPLAELSAATAELDAATRELAHAIEPDRRVSVREIEERGS